MRKDRETLGVAGAVGGWEPVSQRGGALGSTAGLLQAQRHVLLAGTRCCPPSWLSQDEQIALLVGEMLWPPPGCVAHLTGADVTMWPGSGAAWRPGHPCEQDAAGDITAGGAAHISCAQTEDHLCFR